MQTSTLRVLSVAAWLTVGCGDSLVGGDCAPGFAPGTTGCVPIEIAGNSVGAGGDGGEGGDGEGANGGAGGLECSGGLLACNDVCVDVQNNPNHCGACGLYCPSGICIDNACVGTVPGHVVVIGIDAHGYLGQTAPATLIGNAVFLPNNPTLRILDYVQYAERDPDNVLKLVVEEASRRGRELEYRAAADASKVPDNLVEQRPDVFLIRHQMDAPAGALFDIGTAWQQPLAAYVAQGGVVVTLVSTHGTKEMKDFLTASELMPVETLTAVTGQHLETDNFLDALGQNVTSPFLAPSYATSFGTPLVPGGGTSFVVSADSSAPVAIHRVIE